MPTQSAAVLQVRNVRKQYGHLVALNDVSFEVRPGEVLGLLGPNGSGKTTLFECLAGTLPRDAGSVVTIPGELAPPPPATFLYYVPDGINPWPSETVRWVLDYVTGFFGGRRDTIPAFVDALELSQLLDSRIGSLSKGQRKRVLLAVGLLTQSPLLLIDEPFEGLDLRQTRAVSALIRMHASSGRTLFLSIHQISDAARVCDRFILLGGGKVRGEGTLDELAKRASGAGPGLRPNLEEVFLALT